MKIIYELHPNEHFLNKLNNQPDIQDHLQQNTKVVAVCSCVQEGLLILKCHREPNTKSTSSVILQGYRYSKVSGIR